MTRVLLMRHGATAGNELRQYVGARTDEPLSEQGLAQCRAAGCLPQVRRVYVSPLLRAQQTARLCFPQAGLQVVDDLREFDFGSFEGKSADDLVDDAAYREWVDGWCLGPCPGGEDRASFVQRTCQALESLLRAATVEAGGASRCEGLPSDASAVERASCRPAVEQDDSLVVVVAHGGTIMAALSALARDAACDDGYFEWQVKPCEGYVAQVQLTDGQVTLADPRRVIRLDEVALVRPA